MSGDSDDQQLLLSAIENAAARVLDEQMPAPWAGHQLVALVRYWGYGGHQLAMPDAFARFDLTMADLECFPNGRMTSDEQIIEAAREVLIAARGRAQQVKGRRTEPTAARRET
jgi:hypothetical protein